MAQIRDSVRVAARLKPFNAREIRLGVGPVVQMSDNEVVVTDPTITGKRNFVFNKCLDSSTVAAPSYADQETVFKEVCLPVVDNFMAGFNGAVLAYDQSGSGKSYSIFGSPGDPGLTPRIAAKIFESIRSSPVEVKDNVVVRMSENYLNIPFDLLTPSKTKLKLRLDPLDGPFLEGATEEQELLAVIKRGNKLRSTDKTLLNETSSRSHCLVRKITMLSDHETSEVVSKMAICDLAGSECAAKSGASGSTLDEGSSINKSLLALSGVMKTLALISSGKKKKGTFVNFRDSTLTYLLTHYLSGKARTTMLNAVSPSLNNLAETTKSVTFGETVKEVRVTAEANKSESKKRNGGVIVSANNSKDTAREQQLLEEIEDLKWKNDLEKRKHDAVMAELQRRLEEARGERQQLENERKEREAEGKTDDATLTTKDPCEVDLGLTCQRCTHKRLKKGKQDGLNVKAFEESPEGENTYQDIIQTAEYKLIYRYMAQKCYIPPSPRDDNAPLPPPPVTALLHIDPVASYLQLANTSERPVIYEIAVNGSNFLVDRTLGLVEASSELRLPIMPKHEKHPQIPTEGKYRSYHLMFFRLYYGVLCLSMRTTSYMPF